MRITMLMRRWMNMKMDERRPWGLRWKSGNDDEEMDEGEEVDEDAAVRPEAKGGGGYEGERLPTAVQGPTSGFRARGGSRVRRKRGTRSPPSHPAPPVRLANVPGE